MSFRGFFMCFTVVRILKNPLEDGQDTCVIVPKRIFRVVETLPFGSFFSTVYDIGLKFFVQVDISQLSF